MLPGISGWEPATTPAYFVNSAQLAQTGTQSFTATTNNYLLAENTTFVGAQTWIKSLVFDDRDTLWINLSNNGLTGWSSIFSASAADRLMHLYSSAIQTYGTTLRFTSDTAFAGMALSPP